MYCPACGRENSLEQKFCAGCGVNLYAVAQALTRREDDFFTKMDAGMDALLGRYNEHVFRRPPTKGHENSVARSWILLGQAVVTALLDLMLFTLMSVLLPIRLLMLAISTPFRLLAERGSRAEIKDDELEEYSAPELTSGRWRDDAPASVTENTTTLFDTGKIRR
jgi:hypothetical protein